MGQTFSSHTVVSAPTGPDAPVTPEPVKTAQDRPQWLPEKFKSPEDMAKAYSELEKKQSAAAPKPTAPVAPKAPAVEPPKATPTPEEEAAKTAEPDGKEDTEEKTTEDADKKTETPKAPDAIPEHLQKFSTEFAEKGELSEESYKELAEKHNIPKAYVDAYINGLQAQADAYTQALFAETGGEEGFKALNSWALENVPEEEIAVINSALSSQDKTKATVALRGLMARYNEANGVQPNLITGETAGSSGVKPFLSTAEVVAAMGDRRYKTDEAYRKQVEDRLAVSDAV